MTPGLRSMPAITSAEVAICGTHFGDTKDPASTFAEARRAQAVDQLDLDRGRDLLLFSFCRPSRAPTSTMLTRLGYFMR